MSAQLSAMLPEAALVLGAVLLLGADLSRKMKVGTTLGGAVLFAAAAGLLLFLAPGGDPFPDNLTLDKWAIASRAAVAVGLVLTLLMSRAAAASGSTSPAEYSALLLLAGGALMTLASAVSWLVVLVALETYSVAFAVLIGTGKRAGAGEAALKYFILSAFASAFLLFGAALWWSCTGSFRMAPPAIWGVAECAAMFMILAGLSFKVTLAPFHMWAPDVYAAGPLPIVAFAASASKVAGFAVLARAFLLCGGAGMPGGWASPWALAAFSAAAGTALALTQKDVTRMLAYSGVSQAGFMAMALASGAQAAPALFFFVVMYAAATLGAFAVLVAASPAESTREGLAGLSRRSPVLALALAVCMVSLTGLPPFAGFVAKFVLFKSALVAGHLWLVLLALVASVVSAGFYLRLLVPVYMEPSVPGAPRPGGGAAATGIAIVLALVILAAGVFPQPLLDMAAGLIDRIP